METVAGAGTSVSRGFPLFPKSSLFFFYVGFNSHVVCNSFFVINSSLGEFSGFGEFDEGKGEDVEDELVLELRQCRNHNGTKVFHLAKHVLPILVRCGF